MKSLRLIVCSFLVLGVLSPVFAADEKPAAKKVDPEKAFKRLDKDKDGKLTWEEFKTRPSKTERTEEETKKLETRLKGLFSRMDKDKDKKVTLEEFKDPAPAKKKKADAE